MFYGKTERDDPEINANMFFVKRHMLGEQGSFGSSLIGPREVSEPL